MDDHYDTIVIGGGQAGLAMGYELQRRRRRFLILERAPAIGQSWRTRWDSLRLFTPVHVNHLPGLPFPGPPDHYPSKDAAADYLLQYAATFALPVRLNCAVQRVARHDTGYMVETEQSVFHTRQLVIATGPFQTPALPAWAADLPPSITQLHSSQYRNPSQLAEGPVLVVGAGNSGMQIAEELAEHRAVALAVGTRLPELPMQILGRTLFWWLRRAGVMRLSIDSRLGRWLRTREVVIGTRLQTLQAKGVTILPRVMGHVGSELHAADGRILSADTIIWATGYRPDYPWLALPILDAQGHPQQYRGITTLPGVVFLGLPWQYRRGSALLGGVGEDASYLAEHLDTLPPPYQLHNRR